jgi:hypothetical protein
MLIRRVTDQVKTQQREISPLLENGVSGDAPLTFYNLLHPTMLGIIFCVFAISSILSAFETVPLDVP